MDKTQPHPMFKLATELGPLLVFFFVNAKFNLFAATGAFMVAIVAAMIASYVVTRHIPIMAIVTGTITGTTIMTGIAGRAARIISVCPDLVPGGHGWDGDSLRISRRSRSSPAEASAPL